MSDTAKHSAQNLFRIDLDREISSLPARTLQSLRELFLQLERSAVLRERTSAAMETSVSAGNPGLPSCNPAANGVMAFREMGRGVLATVKAQVRTLLIRAQEVQAVILINDWRTAGRLWAGLLNDCKMPLAELEFLEELWGIRPSRLEVDGWSLTRHRHHFVLIRAEIEIQLARRRSLLELSDAVERHLGDWLRRFEAILERLDEESLA
jgi:hypothetical protein